MKNCIVKVIGAGVVLSLLPVIAPAVVILS